MPSSVTSSNHGELATLVNRRSSSPTMSTTTTTLSPPSPVMRGGGKHDHHSNIISHDAMADVKSKIEKLASEIKEQQKQQRCRQQSSNTRPTLPHLNTDSITTIVRSQKRPVLSPFTQAKSHQIQYSYTPHPGLGSDGIPGFEPTSRSLSDLHNERSYLLHNLQTQEERATRLYQRYAHLEAKKEALKAGTTSSPSSSSGENKNNAATGSTSMAAKKKKTKKDLSLLRSRIAEFTQQKQLIMLRLGEIHLELVNRGRWVMTHQNQHQDQQQMVYSPMSAVVEGQGYFGQRQWQQRQGQYQLPATPMSADSYSNSPVGGNGEYLYIPSVLSPFSPSFVPGGGVSFFEGIWSRPSQSQFQVEKAQDHQPSPDEAAQVEEQHEHQAAEREEDEDQTPKPHSNDLEAVLLSAVTPKFTTTTASTVSTLPSEHLATPITPGRIPWDEYPSDSEDDGSFDSFDGGSFTPIGVAVSNPFGAVSSCLVHGTNASSNSGLGSGSGVLVSAPGEDQEQGQEAYGEEAGEEEEEQRDAEISDDSASEPGHLLSEQQRRTALFSQDGNDEEEPVSWKGSNRRLSIPCLKNIWPAALKAVGVQMGFGEEEKEEVPEMRLDSVI